MGGKAKTLEDLREGGLSGGVALLREYIGADEKKRKLVTQILLRLAAEMGEGLWKSVGQYWRSLGESIEQKYRSSAET